MGNLIVSDGGDDKVLKYSGVSNTLDTSIEINSVYGVAYYEEDLIVSEITNDKILLCSGFSNTVSSSFNAPNTNVYAILVENHTLYSLDAGNTVYVHSGITSTVSDSFNPANGSVNYSLGSDGSNLLETEFGWGDKTVFKMSGFSSTISDSFEHSYDFLGGVTWDANEDFMLVASAGGSQITKHSGFSSIVLNSYSSLGDYKDITLDDRNPIPECHLITSDQSANKIYRHKGLRGVVHDSISSPSTNPCGVAWHNNNLYSFDSDDIYLHIGFSTTISDSFQLITLTQEFYLTYDDALISCSPDSNIVSKYSGFSEDVDDSFSAPGINSSGVTVDSDGNILTASYNADSIYKHSGFSSTVSTSFSSPYTLPRGLTIDANDNLISIDDDSNKIYLHSGISSTITDSFSSPSSNPMGCEYDCRVSEAVGFKNRNTMII